jgi:hypothetical protein
MAKKTAVQPEAPAAPATAPTTTPERTASKATMKLVESVREQFTGYLSGYNALQTTRAKLAPLFMRAFNAWAGDTGGSFVAFVRLYDPTVPLQSEGYRAHSTYAAAEYLRRKARDLAAESAAEVEGEELVGATGVGAEAPATPLDVLARFVAMLLPLIAHEDQGRIWEFFASDAHWSERRITALREMVDLVKPFATVRTEKGQPRPTLHIVHTRKDARTGTTG